MDFPFQDAENTAVFTCAHVLEKNHDICYVAHDEVDGAWQFLCGNEDSVSDARVISLREIYEMDASVGDLADTPYGCGAIREDRDSVWQKFIKR